MTVRSLEGGKLNPFSLYPVVNNVPSPENESFGLAFYPSATTDDATWATGGGWNSAQNQGYIGNVSASARHSVFCFRNIIIPTGSVIDEAYVYFCPYSSKSGTTVNVNIYLNDTSFPTMPTSTALAEALVLTSPIAWNNISAWTAGVYERTPDIKTLVQGIIDKADWYVNNNIIVVIRDNGSSSGAYRDWVDYTYTSKFLPVLKIVAKYPSDWEVRKSAYSYDDGYWKTGTFSNNGEYVYIGKDSISENSFFRFSSIPYDIDSKIDYAFLTLTPAVGDTSYPSLNYKIWFNDSANAVAPISESEANALSLASSLNGIDWDISNISWLQDLHRFNSPNIGSHMTEILNNSSWLVDNSVMLIVKDDSSTDYIGYYSMVHGEYYPILVFHENTTGCTKGYILGGYNGADRNYINGFTFATETSSLLTTTLLAARRHIAGVNSVACGYGLGDSAVVTVQVLVFGNETMRYGKENMDLLRDSPAAVQSITMGYTMAGNGWLAGAVGIQSYNFSSEVSATLSDYMSQRKYYNFGVNTEIKGYSLGGLPPSGDRDLIEDLTYSTEISTLLVNTLSADRTQGASCNSLTKGYCIGGSSASIMKSIDGFLFSTESCALLSATLDTAKELGGGTNNISKGYHCGGHTGAVYKDTIEDLDFSSETSVVISAVLNTALARFYGVQNGGVL